MERIPLTDAEWLIMEKLWQETPQTITELTHGLSAETGWTKHTVIALLKRMLEKGTVRMEQGRKAKAYYPLVSKEQVARQQTDTLLSRLFDGRISLLVADLVAREHISDEELTALQQAIDEARAKEGE